MDKTDLLKALERAESAMRLHLNTAGDSLVIYKLKKFARHPYRYSRIAAYKIGVCGEFAWARTFFGAKIRVPLSDVNAADLYYAGCLRASSEGYVTRFVIDQVREGEVFYDIGANYGFYSMLAATQGALVHAFDPSPHCRPLLEQTFAAGGMEGKIRFNPVALSNTEGTVQFFDTSVGHKSGMSTIEASIAEKSSMPHTRSEVSSVTLNQYVRGHEGPAVMKIDTEGSEAKILEGARALLQKFSPRIVVEIWGDERDSGNSSRVLQLLRAERYQAHRIGQDGTIIPTTIDVTDIGENNNFVFKKAND